jgi:hypothetical protein
VSLKKEEQEIKKIDETGMKKNLKKRKVLSGKKNLTNNKVEM